jgi:hypothetical protein
MQKIVVQIVPNEATQRAAEFACFVQDACNSRAILASLLHHLDEMRAADDAVIGDLRNQPPVVIAVLDKLASLARVQNISGDEGNRIMDAHSACDRLRQGLEVEWELFPLR